MGHDPALSPQEAGRLGVEAASLPQLLERVDIVSLHVPLSPQTRHMIDEPALCRAL